MKSLFGIVLIGIILSASTTFAHSANNNFSQSCESEQRRQFSRGLELTPDDLRIYEEGNLKASINPVGELRIDGALMALDGQARQAAIDYQKAIRELMPKVHGIADEAIGIAEVVTSQVLIEVLELSDEDVAELQLVLQQSRDNLRAYFESNSIRLGGTSADDGWGDSLFDQGFGEDLEAAIEKIVYKAKFRIIGKLMSELFSSEEGAEAFAERMETMGGEIEKSMEGFSAAMEGRAAELCSDLNRISDLEEKIVAAVPAFGHYTLLD